MIFVSFQNDKTLHTAGCGFNRGILDRSDLSSIASSERKFFKSEET